MNLDWVLGLFWLKKLLSILLLPPLLPFVLIFAGLLIGRRRARGGRLLVWTGLVVGVALVTPVSVGWMLEALEPRVPLRAEQLADAQAVVILGGGRTSDAPEYGGDTVNRLTLERLRYGARLARRSGLPVLVSGGAPSGDIPEAILMKSALEEDFGIRVRWVEPSSRDTRENARYSALQLKASGITHIALVTHAAHMKRAQLEFESQGLQVVSAPTAWQGPRDGRNEGDALAAIPNPAAAYAGWYAAHEWLGLLAYRLSR
ncbi:YdcF family protein [Azoarcus sp. L1K30]|uniref:YdcF family protein n=1 Tax=Azoarcus sp. L1K30 TaxID=2820277 RepID=UPI001B83602F|nr:YdcF family protein [Azoarcus sp. L1K30]MBR0567944.1 YdcF family protein [Azoarcus sp. L1K30]